MLRCAKVVVEGLFECRGCVSYAVALARDCRKIKIWGVAVTKDAQITCKYGELGPGLVWCRFSTASKKAFLVNGTG